MKRLLACGALLFVASFAPVRAAPHSRANPDAAMFWSQRSEETVAAALSRQAPVPFAPESVTPPPVARATQRKTPPRRGQLLLAVLILCGVASKQRLPQRAFAWMKRLHHRPSAAERGRTKVCQLRIVAATLADAEVRTHLDAICGTSDEIFTLSNSDRSYVAIRDSSSSRSTTFSRSPPAIAISPAPACTSRRPRSRVRRRCSRASTAVSGASSNACWRTI